MIYAVIYIILYTAFHITVDAAMKDWEKPIVDIFKDYELSTGYKIMICSQILICFTLLSL